MPRAVAASSTALRARRRASARSRLWSRLGDPGARSAGCSRSASASSSPARPASSPSGTRIAGIDVGGLSARGRTTAARAARGEARDGARRVHRRRPDVPADAAPPWASRSTGARPSRAAERTGGGFGLVRGYRRLGLEFFPQEVAPQAHAYDAGVTTSSACWHGRSTRRTARRGSFATACTSRSHRDPPGASSTARAARAVIVSALASFSRAPVALPVASTRRR